MRVCESRGNLISLFYLCTCWNAEGKKSLSPILVRRVPQSPKGSQRASRGSYFAAGSTTMMRSLWTCCHHPHPCEAAEKTSRPRWNWSCERAVGRSACQCPQRRQAWWSRAASASQHNSGSQHPSEPFIHFRTHPDIPNLNLKCTLVWKWTVYQISVMGRCGVFFAVRTKLLNNI